MKIYLFCQSAAFWGELLYSKNKIQFCLEQSIDGREAAVLFPTLPVLPPKPIRNNRPFPHEASPQAMSPRSFPAA